MASLADTRAGDALVRVRRERVHTTMLIELLVLLVFLAMAFAFVKDSEKRFDTLQDKLKALQAELERSQLEAARLRSANDALAEENEALQTSLRRFMAIQTGTLPANDRLVLVRKEAFDARAARVSDAERIIAERQKENAELRGRLAATGRGGNDLPRCPIASGRFIARIDLLGNGTFRVSPRWPAASSGQVAQVSGLVDLASSAPVSPERFRALAGRMRDWGKAQPTPCGFYAEVYSQHAQLATYKRQYQTVSAYFYAAMR